MSEGNTGTLPEWTWFRKLMDKEQKLLLSSWQTQAFEADEAVYPSQHDRCDVHIIRRGSIEVFALTKTGEHRWIGRVDEGEWLGEMTALLAGKKEVICQASAEGCETFMWRAGDMQHFLQTRGHASRIIFDSLLETTYERIASMNQLLVSYIVRKRTLAILRLRIRVLAILFAAITGFVVLGLLW